MERRRDFFVDSPEPDQIVRIRGDGGRESLRAHELDDGAAVMNIVHRRVSNGDQVGPRCSAGDGAHAVSRFRRLLALICLRHVSRWRYAIDDTRSGR